MAEPARSTPRDLVLGLFLTCASLFLGNLLGLIVSDVWGWEIATYDRPSGVALAAVQGALGAFLALFACERWSTFRAGKLWLLVAIGGLSLIQIGLLGATLWTHQLEMFLSWKTLAAVANIIAIALARRGYEP